MTEAIVATCWTSAGDAAPMRASEASPVDPLERVRAVAEAGYRGMGWVLEDLRAIKAGVGYAAVAEAMAAVGLSHVEVELVGEWWKPDEVWRGAWKELLEASDAFGGAAMIKAGTDQAPALEDPTVLAPAFRRLGIEAEAHGTRVALEPLPFGMVASMPAGAELVRATDHPACGLVVDYWHIFRAGTSFSDVVNNLTPEMIFGVELNDADAEPIGTLFEDTRDRRRYPGEGVQDMHGFVQCMRDLGYQGAWGVEILSEEHRSLSVAEGLRRAFRATEAIL
ncbi:TIM barrel protein [Galactobacter sp.]|uniref:sugar phosphate isomerase/epimerase family protein n=1 Tax=Galactobacter sp. TaxID=2676125 RepID=UPI0025C6DDAE|nr:TIM barrel protein [Galactobacter sp.]